MGTPADQQVESFLKQNQHRFTTKPPAHPQTDLIKKDSGLGWAQCMCEVLGSILGTT